MSTFHPAASSLANFNDTISMISTTRLFIKLHQLFSSRQEPTFVMASQLTLFGDQTVNIKSTRRAFGFVLPAEYAVKYTQRRGFGGVVDFCLSLLSAFWVLSAYFLAVLEMSVCAY